MTRFVLKDPGSRWFRLWRIVGFLRRYASTRGFRVYDTFLACVGTASLRRGPRHSASRGAPWIDYFAEASVRVVLVEETRVSGRDR